MSSKDNTTDIENEKENETFSIKNYGKIKNRDENSHNTDQTDHNGPLTLDKGKSEEISIEFEDKDFSDILESKDRINGKAIR